MLENSFWEYLDRLLDGSRLVIDRPKGSNHPRFPNFTYPFDYGYLDGTSSADGDGIDVWVGSRGDKSLDAVIVTVDLEKRDSEIKLLLGCEAEDTEIILRAHNDSPTNAAILLKRPKRGV